MNVCWELLLLMETKVLDIVRVIYYFLKVVVSVVNEYGAKMAGGKVRDASVVYVTATRHSRQTSLLSHVRRKTLTHAEKQRSNDTKTGSPCLVH